MLGVLARRSSGDRGRVASAFGTLRAFTALQHFRQLLKVQRKGPVG
jgi:hypothetical protein